MSYRFAIQEVTPDGKAPLPCCLYLGGDQLDLSLSTR
jgi:hypothetical protein